MPEKDETLREFLEHLVGGYGFIANLIAEYPDAAREPEEIYRMVIEDIQDALDGRDF